MISSKTGLTVGNTVGLSSGGMIDGCNYKHEHPHFVKAKGKVLFVRSDGGNRVLVEFDTSLPMFHGGNSSDVSGRYGYCYWIYDSEVVKINKNKSGW